MISASKLTVDDEVLRPASRAPEAIRFWPPQPFLLFHFAALGAFFVGWRWYYPLLALGSYYFRMFWVTAGYHRYFSHRAYKTSRCFQLAIAFLAMTSMQKGVLWWAAHHRDHHKNSDEIDDVHSPVQHGMFWAHVGWILSPRYNSTNLDRVRDLAAFPELRWLDRFYLIPPLVYGVALFVAGGMPFVMWGGVIGTIVLWHGSFLINSLGHRFGKARYETHDQSRNNVVLALLTCGEGWHNNHHHYQSAEKQGFFWWEVDASHCGLKVLSWVGLVWDLREVPTAVRDAGVRGQFIGGQLPAAGPMP